MNDNIPGISFANNVMQSSQSFLYLQSESLPQKGYTKAIHRDTQYRTEQYIGTRNTEESNT